MLVMSRLSLAATILLVASVLPAGAQNAVEREVKAAPGRDVRVGVYSDIRPDCTAGPLPAIRLVSPPAHGAVNVKRGTLKITNYKQCLATEVPAFIAIYRAADNFYGPDEFLLEIGMTGGRKQLQHFRVNVSAAPGGGQGI
jgi:hypothetical protein